ncbi:MAG: hypothetical protein QOK05_3076 [Chloroflexota bacterium]|jgi:hypothetical protein|nr:hypothetical protein [Chloroflexota bacterium]
MKAIAAGLLLALAACGESTSAPAPAVSPGLEYIQAVQTYDAKFTDLVNAAGQTCNDHPVDATCVTALETAAAQGVTYQHAVLAHPPAGCASTSGQTLSGAIDESVAALALFISGEKTANAATIDAATTRMAAANTAYQAGRTQLSADCKIP